MSPVSVKFESKCNNFNSRKWIRKCLQNGGHFVSALICSLLRGTRLKSIDLISWLTGTYMGTSLNHVKQNGRHFADDIFKWIFSVENAWIPVNFSLKFVFKDPIDNKSALLHVMAWCPTGDKPLPEPMTRKKLHTQELNCVSVQWLCDSAIECLWMFGDRNRWSLWSI